MCGCSTCNSWYFSRKGDLGDAIVVLETPSQMTAADEQITHALQDSKLCRIPGETASQGSTAGLELERPVVIGPGMRQVTTELDEPARPSAWPHSVLLLILSTFYLFSYAVVRMQGGWIVHPPVDRFEKSAQIWCRLKRCDLDCPFCPLSYFAPVRSVHFSLKNSDPLQSTMKGVAARAGFGNVLRQTA
jgi:hypothetical protein